MNKAIETTITKLALRFIPKDSLIGITRSKIKAQNPKLKTKYIKIEAKKTVLKVLKKLLKNEDWKARKIFIFDGKYPSVTNEFLNRGDFAHFGNSEYNKENLSYEVKQVRQFSTPSPKQLLHMGPKLAKVVNDTVVSSVMTDRLKLMSEIALKNSGLVCIEVLNRPIVGEFSRWEIGSDIPKKIITSNPIFKNPDLTIIEDFVDDLKKTASWKSEDSLATYLACLIQPMLCHLMPGMFPAYMFRGPTKSGKGFLSKKLLDWLYSSNLPRAVSQFKFPKDVYEMSHTLQEAKDSLYYACDEVKDLKEEQTKIFDNIVTAPELSLRVMREGYFRMPNYLTFTMTAVYSNLTDETWGRIALIELVEGRTKNFEIFLKKWDGSAAELLAALFKKLTDNLETIKCYSTVENRRPGFGLISEATVQVFGIRPAFELVETANQVLEVVCDLEGDPKISFKGKRKRLSVKVIREKYNEDMSMNDSVPDFFLKLKTALGTGNKRIYCAENGKTYKITLNEEGESARKMVYVKKIN